MPDAYDVHDAQFLQWKLGTSAADALTVGLGAVPDGKVWTVLMAVLYSSIAETQDYWFSVYNSKSGNHCVVRRRLEASVGTTAQLGHPFLEEGLEMKLFPGDYLQAYRDVATAGSTLSLQMRFVETDLQYYVELDKHKVLRRRQNLMMESNPATRGGLIGPSSRSIPSRPSEGRGRFER